MKNIYEELLWRGLVYQESNNCQELFKKGNSPITVYAGFDPTSDSLHIGNLIPLIMLKRFKDFGNKVIVLAGGATGMIGDPSGKVQERNLLNHEIIKHNLSYITPQLEKIIGLDENAICCNNADWLTKLNLIDFLRDFGKYFSVNKMIQRDSVSSRLAEQGISYTEFSYMLFQAYDFYHLNKTYSCNLQIGGSDQWGNMVSGLNLVRRLNNETAHILTCPLLTMSDGKKFGKSEKGAIYLSAHKTSPYEFYQYWLNIPDADIIKLLKTFTFLEKDFIKDLENKVEKEPHFREAQKKLAEEMTNMVHGEEHTKKAINTSLVLFGKGDIDMIDETIFNSLYQSTGEINYSSINEPAGILQVIVDANLAPSTRQARSLIKGNAISLNNKKINDENYQFKKDDLKLNKFIIIRKGKKDFSVIKFSS